VFAPRVVPGLSGVFHGPDGIYGLLPLFADPLTGNKVFKVRPAHGVGSCGDLLVFGLQQPQEFAHVHAAGSTSSRQAGVGLVRRRSMPAVEVQ
jgi:hypothetical protein